jgi:hypothetical protein
LSGRGLGKLCNRHNIPVLPRGWWAKKAAGHPVERTPLPAAGRGTQIRFTFEGPKPRTKQPKALLTRIRSFSTGARMSIGSRCRRFSGFTRWLSRRCLNKGNRDSGERIPRGDVSTCRTLRTGPSSFRRCRSGLRNAQLNSVVMTMAHAHRASCDGHHVIRQLPLEADHSPRARPSRCLAVGDDHIRDPPLNRL